MRWVADTLVLVALVVVLFLVVKALVRVVVVVVVLAHDDTSRWDRMTRVGRIHARETTTTCGRTIGSNTVLVVLVLAVVATDGGATNRQLPWPRPLSWAFSPKNWHDSE